jgi:hypothetical protein
VTALERRARLLLMAYPAGYRRQRGGEILSTLLEATPAGRDWPLARDSRALVIAGLKVRTGQNRSLGTAVSLHLAALLGVAVYLSLGAGRFVSYFLFVVRNTAVPEWRFLAFGLLVALAVLLSFLAGRKLVLAGALAAGVLPAYSGLSGGTAIVPVLAVLLPLAALVALAGGTERPPRAWLGLAGLAAVVPVLLGGLATSAAEMTSLSAEARNWLWAFMVVAAVASIGLDARPAVALAVYFGLLGLFQLPFQLPSAVQHGDIPPVSVLLLVAAVLAVPAVWVLRRQTVL